MAARSHRWALSMLLAASVLGLGCNVLSLPFFLFGPEPKVPAEFRPLASEKKDRKVRVVILALQNRLETRPELSGVDRELTRKVAQHLLANCKDNDEKIAVVPPSQVDQYKADTPNWRTLDFKDDIGKHWDADYVIVLEINSLSLYQSGSGNTLFRGKANITVSLVNCFDQDEATEKKEFVKEYPTENKGEIAVGDMTVTQFREQFIDYIAKNLSWYFTAHPTADRYSCE
jgi:hypothetical protein